MRQKIRLVLAGGGTGGHIMPNIAIIDELKRKYPGKNRLEILYIGSRDGMEKDIIREHGIRYKGIFCGKLRRYFSFRNMLDFLKVPVGVLQSFFILMKFKPDVVFCKGGYVSLPVVIGGFLAGKKVVLHESDVVPGLANRLGEKFAKKVMVSYEESKNHFKHKHKIIVTGNPVRRMIASGNREDGYKLAEIAHGNPVVLIVGGSLGASAVNQFIWDNLGKLLKKYSIVHITGKGKKIAREDLKMKIGYDADLLPAYKQFDFLGKEIQHIYAMADVIVGRAGAVTLAEIDYLQKPSILIPLGIDASRGDQIVNAEVFAKTHNSAIINQSDLEIKTFIKTIDELLLKEEQNGKNKEHKIPAAEIIANLLLLMI